MSIMTPSQIKLARSFSTSPIALRCDTIIIIFYIIIMAVIVVTIVARSRTSPIGFVGFVGFISSGGGANIE